MSLGAIDAPAADPAVVLMVEDDPSLGAALAATLKAAGYKCVRAATAAEGLRWHAHHGPDLVLLDLGLPDRDGLTVIRDLRSRGSTPIIVLSARDSEAVKVEALDLGADDYVNKPFGVDELLARIRAGLRHGVQARGAPPKFDAGDLVIDMGLRTVTLAGEPVKLSPKEYDLLAELAVRQGGPVSHRDLLTAVWGRDSADMQYLRVYVAQLRRKLGDRRILSVPGVGYRLAL
jgi:two-component system KDP operon response regulator KdpE